MLVKKKSEKICTSVSMALFREWRIVAVIIYSPENRVIFYFPKIKKYISPVSEGAGAAKSCRGV